MTSVRHCSKYEHVDTCVENQLDQWSPPSTLPPPRGLRAKCLMDQVKSLIAGLTHPSDNEGRAVGQVSVGGAPRSCLLLAYLPSSLTMWLRGQLQLCQGPTDGVPGTKHTVAVWETLWFAHWPSCDTPITRAHCSYRQCDSWLEHLRGLGETTLGHQYEASLGVAELSGRREYGYDLFLQLFWSISDAPVCSITFPINSVSLACLRLLTSLTHLRLLLCSINYFLI